MSGSVSEFPRSDGPVTCRGPRRVIGARVASADRLGDRSEISVVGPPKEIYASGQVPKPSRKSSWNRTPIRAFSGAIRLKVF
jgi:hypothetical protein